jgi:hypothetical protein
VLSKENDLVLWAIDVGIPTNVSNIYTQSLINDSEWLMVNSNAPINIITTKIIFFEK